MSKKTLSSAMLVLLVATGALAAVAQATTSAPTRNCRKPTTTTRVRARASNRARLPH